MRHINVECIDGIHREAVYEIRELSLLRHNLECKESQKRGIKYLEIPCAFDIETTTLHFPETEEKTRNKRNSSMIH